jgi:hypothetical protein
VIYPTDITAPSLASLLVIVFMCKKDMLTIKNFLLRRWSLATWKWMQIEFLFIFIKHFLFFEPLVELQSLKKVIISLKLESKILSRCQNTDFVPLLPKPLKALTTFQTTNVTTLIHSPA